MENAREEAVRELVEKLYASKAKEFWVMEDGSFDKEAFLPALEKAGLCEDAAPNKQMYRKSGRNAQTFHILICKKCSTENCRP